MTKYGAIYADPPWLFKAYSGPRVPQRAKTQHYGVVAHPGLVAMSPRHLAALDCALFMWTVDSHLDQALALIDAWGFKFKTVAFVWAKPKPFGMGYWTRKRAEICLLATVGKPKRLSGGVDQLIEAPRREHSRKPEEARQRIEQLVAGPYLEMFARTTVPGWDSWGLEVGKFDAVADPAHPAGHDIKLISSGVPLQIVAAPADQRDVPDDVAICGPEAINAG
jgi:N6-adenosine-specific RNA methylase IME4